MPVTCDECGATFSYEHALDCKKEGFITRRHNEVRDTLGDLSSIVYKGHYPGTSDSRGM